MLSYLGFFEFFIVVCLLLCNYYKTASLPSVGKSMPDPPRDFYATFRKGNITLSFQQAIKNKDGDKFMPVNLIIFSD